MWRRLGEREEIVEVTPGVSLSIPLGTHFQLRNDAAEPLAAVAVTMPPWPGDDEAYSSRASGPRASAAEAGLSVSRPETPCRCHRTATAGGGRP